MSGGRESAEREGRLLTKRRNLICCQFPSQYCQILKGASFKEATPSLGANLASCFPQIPVDCVHIAELGSMSDSGESVHQSAKNSVYCPFVNIWIRSVQVAQRFRKTVRPGLEHEPFMPRTRAKRPIDCQPKLKGHVEARCWWRVPVKLHSGQVVKRVAAFPNQLDDALEPTFAAGNLNSRARSQTKCAETGDKSQIEIFVVTVVGDVEESGLLPGALAHRALAGNQDRAPEVRKTALLLCFDRLVGDFRDLAAPFDLIFLARASKRRIRVFDIPYVSAKSSAVGNGVVMTTCLRIIVRYSI